MKYDSKFKSNRRSFDCGALRMTSKYTLAAVVGEGGGEGFFWLGADAEVGVGFGEEDPAVFRR